MSRSGLSSVPNLDEDVLGHLFAEAERALLDVEGRPDEPHRRVILREAEPEDIEELRLAVAELFDGYPSLSSEVEVLLEQLRVGGVRSTARALEVRPHVLQLVRLSLEIFFRRHPSAESFETSREEEDDDLDEEAPSPAEIYAGHRRLWQSLRSWVS
ncbi:MAG: hypothetical protein HC923_02160 [Myxococcales bacterium]|nr:hypothetical protein [Myxococcales bacterium]